VEFNIGDLVVRTKDKNKLGKIFCHATVPFGCFVCWDTKFSDPKYELYIDISAVNKECITPDSLDENLHHQCARRIKIISENTGIPVSKIILKELPANFSVRKIQDLICKPNTNDTYMEAILQNVEWEKTKRIRAQKDRGYHYKRCCEIEEKEKRTHSGKYFFIQETKTLAKETVELKKENEKLKKQNCERKFDLRGSKVDYQKQGDVEVLTAYPFSKQVSAGFFGARDQEDIDRIAELEKHIRNNYCTDRPKNTTCYDCSRFSGVGRKCFESLGATSYLPKTKCSEFDYISKPYPHKEINDLKNKCKELTELLNSIKQFGNKVS